MLRSTLIFTVLTLFVTPTNAQTVRHTDRVGNLTGTTTREGGRFVDRDKSGNQLGYWQREGSQMVHRDKSGNLLNRESISDRH